MAACTVRKADTEMETIPAAQRYANVSAKIFGKLLFMCALLVCSNGCISFMANMVRVIKGTDAPAEFDELNNKKVAVVANTPVGLNADATGIITSSHVHSLLAAHVKKVQMISQEEVSRIISDEPAGKREMATLGRRMGADYVVLIDVADLKLRDGQTLFKGSSNSSVSVFKMSEGSGTVFRKSLSDFVFPQTGVPVTDVDEATFQGFYLREVAQRLARSFYPYDPTIDVAKDASVVSIQSFQ